MGSASNLNAAKGSVPIKSLKNTATILIANKIFHVTVLLVIYFCVCGTENLSHQTSLQCLSTINMEFSNKDKILIKSLYLKGYTAKGLIDEFPEKH